MYIYLSIYALFFITLDLIEWHGRYHALVLIYLFSCLCPHRQMLDTQRALSEPFGASERKIKWVRGSGRIKFSGAFLRKKILIAL